MIICREVVSSKYNKQKFEIFWVPWVRILLGTAGSNPSGTGGWNPFGYRGFESFRYRGFESFRYRGLESFRVPRVRILPVIEPLGRLKRTYDHVPTLSDRTYLRASTLYVISTK